MAGRGGYRPRITPVEPLPGIAAKHPGQCDRCNGPIARNDRIVFVRGHAIHCRCASGADDE